MNGSAKAADGTTAYGFTAPLYRAHGSWTINVVAKGRPTTGRQAEARATSPLGAFNVNMP